MARTVSRIGVKVVLPAVIAGGIIFGVLPPAADSQAGMAVYDSTNHMTNVQSLANTAKSLAETQKLVNETTQMRSTLGNVGASPFGASGFTSGISAQLSGMQCLFPNLHLFNIPRSIMPNFGSVCSSRSFFNDMLTLEEVDGRRRPPEITRERVLSNREQMRKDAALNGLSLAYQQKQDVPQSAQRIQSIAADAAAASDLVGKVDATNRLLAVLAEQMIAQRMLLAGILEVTASETLQGIPVNFATSINNTAPYPTGGSYRLGQ